jgi:nucleoid DNA-binding protein
MNRSQLTLLVAEKQRLPTSHSDQIIRAVFAETRAALARREK